MRGAAFANVDNATETNTHTHIRMHTLYTPPNFACSSSLSLLSALSYTTERADSSFEGCGGFVVVFWAASFWASSLFSLPRVRFVFQLIFYAQSERVRKRFLPIVIIVLYFVKLCLAFV